MKIIKIIFGVSLALTISSCGSLKNKTTTKDQKTTSKDKGTTLTTDSQANSSTFEEKITIDPRYNGKSEISLFKKKTELTKGQLKTWPHMDIYHDSIPGMSLARAYQFLKGKKGKNVIVGVIDSGIDIEHEDLKNTIWINKDEIPNNGKDDDNNGYIDDIYGWNFLGGEKGSSAPEQFEQTRIVKNYQKVLAENGDKMKQGNNKKFKTFADRYYTLKKEVDNKRAGAEKKKNHYTKLIASIKKTDNEIKVALSKEIYSVDDIIKFNWEDKPTREGKEELIKFIKEGKKIEDGIKELNKKLNRANSEYDHYYNIDFNGRVTGDDPNNIRDIPYGNNNVIGSKDHEIHGTHVAGIILAERNNGKGMNGVAHNASLMSIRAIPDGDEYDKDVALAIRYAADNGAKVINMSFIKSYSPRVVWVYDAIQYAQRKDVLLVHAAGNSHKNMDIESVYPTDSRDLITEYTDNVITVGAITHTIDKDLVAYFSNYGSKNVDVFAPGVNIYATFPNNDYQSISGTSMAAPQVAGVAALIRSYYPSLTASQVKQIIMNSGVSYKQLVKKPQEKGKADSLVSFSSLSVSGKILNAYKAILLADKMSNKVKK